MLGGESYGAWALVNPVIISGSRDMHEAFDLNGRP